MAHTTCPDVEELSLDVVHTFRKFPKLHAGWAACSICPLMYPPQHAAIAKLVTAGQGDHGVSNAEIAEADDTLFLAESS